MAEAWTVNGERPTSSTYVRPLENRDPGVAVLCVAPEESLLGTLSTGVERANPDVTCFEARTPDEAFEVLDAEDIGCVVSTLTLDNVGGVAFLEDVRETYDDLPVVFVAADGSESLAAEAINAGAEGYVPFEGAPDDATFETLVDRIETVVRDYRSHQRFEDATELLFRLTEYTTDTLWMFTGDWEETVVINEAYEDVWGRNQTDLIDDPSDFVAGIHPEDRSEVRAAMETLSKGTPVDMEYRILTDDGVTWTSVHAEPVLSDGEVEYVAGFTRDVTERRKRERTLDGLREVASDLMSAETRSEVVDLTIGATERIFDYSIAGIRLVNDDGSLEMGGTTTDTESILQADFPVYEPGEGFVGEAFESGEPRIVDDLSEVDSEMDYGPIGSAISIPLGRHGVLSVGSERVGRFDESDVDFARLLTRLTESALDQVERERTLQDRTNKLETLLNNSPLVFYSLEPDGQIVESRGRGLERLGLRPGEVVGTSIFDLYGHVPEVQAIAERALGGERVSETVSVEDLWFDNTFVPIFEDGELTQVIGVAFDVTAQKTAEEQFAALSESAIALSDSDARECAVEEALVIAERVLGERLVAYWDSDPDADRLVATAVSDAVDALEEGTDAPLVHEADDPVWRVYERGETVVDNDFTPADTANESPLESMVFAPVEGHGLLTVGARKPGAFGERDRHLVGTLAGLLRSTLDRLENERELEASQTELERSNESLQQFAYVASHDLQEPLRMVSSYVSLLEAEYGDAFDEEGEEYLHYAVDGATRMQEMIDALLQYSRVHTRGDEFVDVDVETVFEETTQSLAMLVGEEDATVHSGDLPRVTADRSQVGQLLQNLVKNAIEHAGPEPTVEVDAVHEGDQVHFTVSDDGPGIDDSQHDRIFEIFKSNEGGTGIGLAMCKRIAQRHDGDIWVESESGAGATFHVTLPAAADDPEAGTHAVGDETSASGIQRTTDGGHE